MQDFFSFIKEYGATIIAALGVLLSFICIVVKKRPKTIEEFFMCLEEVLDDVPAATIAAETVSKDGIQKYYWARQKLLKALDKKIGRKLSSYEYSFAINAIDKQIESVLDAPQKKKKGESDG